MNIIDYFVVIWSIGLTNDYGFLVGSIPAMVWFIIVPLCSVVREAVDEL